MQKLQTESVSIQGSEETWSFCYLHTVIPTAVPALFDGEFSLDHFPYGFVENQEVYVFLWGTTPPP